MELNDLPTKEVEVRMISDSVAAAGSMRVWVKPGPNLPVGLAGQAGKQVTIVGKTGAPQRPPVLFNVKTEEGTEVPGVAPCHLSATAPATKEPRDRTAEAAQGRDIYLNTTGNTGSSWENVAEIERQGWIAVVEYLRP